MAAAQPGTRRSHPSWLPHTGAGTSDAGAKLGHPGSSQGRAISIQEARPSYPNGSDGKLGARKHKRGNKMLQSPQLEQPLSSPAQKSRGTQRACHLPEHLPNATPELTAGGV